MVPLCVSVLNFMIRNPDRWLTRNQIAKGAGRSKSPSLIKCLDAYVSEGLLIDRYYQYRDMPGYFEYFLDSVHIVELQLWDGFDG